MWFLVLEELARQIDRRGAEHSRFGDNRSLLGSVEAIMGGDGVKTQHPLKSKTMWAATALAVVGNLDPTLIASLGPWGTYGIAALMMGLRLVTDKPLSLK